MFRRGPLDTILKVKANRQIGKAISRIGANELSARRYKELEKMGFGKFLSATKNLRNKLVALANSFNEFNRELKKSAKIDASLFDELEEFNRLSQEKNSLIYTKTNEAPASAEDITLTIKHIESQLAIRRAIVKYLRLEVSFSKKEVEKLTKGYRRYLLKKMPSMMEQEKEFLTAHEAIVHEYTQIRAELTKLQNGEKKIATKALDDFFENLEQDLQPTIEAVQQTEGVTKKDEYLFIKRRSYFEDMLIQVVLIQKSLWEQRKRLKQVPLGLKRAKRAYGEELREFARLQEDLEALR